MKKTERPIAAPGAVLGFMVFFLALPDTYAEPAKRPQIEEIIVTAQKREQSIQDVPISISVLDGDYMRTEGITDFRDVSLHIPNTTIDNNGEFNDIRIRGFGSPLSNKAFEQSVGLVINGVPYGNRGYFIGPLYDIERVEVLRGPQGTLFGKNTTAGLINVETAAPTDEFRGYIDIEEGEFDRRRRSAGIGGPLLSGFLNLRLSGLNEEQDGTVKNTTAPISPAALPVGGGRARDAFRVQLEFPDLFGGSASLAYDHVDTDLTGGAWEFRSVDPEHVEFYRQFDPNVDFTPGNRVGSLDSTGRIGQEIDILVLNVERTVFEWGLSFVAGYAQQENTIRDLDVDFTPAPMITVADSDENLQKTAELRASSPLLDGLLGLDELFGVQLGSTDLTVGVFYQEREINDSVQSIRLNVPVLAQFVAFQATPTTLAPLSEFTGSTISLGSLGEVTSEEGFGFEETTGFFSQDGESSAVFAQIDWHMTSQWTLQLGMRYTDESKSAFNQRVTTEGSGAAFSALGLRPFTSNLSRSETAFTPKVALKWSVNEDVNFYASWARGFKAGGFNALPSNDDDVSNLEYEPEEMIAWEVGGKLRFLDGAANANFAIYQQNVEDMQVFTVQPSTAVVSVTNAGEAESRGVELDLTWLPAHWLTLRGSLAYNDSEFTEFPLGTCTGDRPDTDGDGDARCDLAGKPFFRTPLWSGTLGGNVRFPFSSIGGWSFFQESGLELMAGVTAEYQGRQFADRTFDERTEEAAFVRYNANIGIGSGDPGWSLRIVGENLTDEETVVQAREVTLSAGTVPGSISDFVQIPDLPRLVYVSFRWTF